MQSNVTVPTSAPRGSVNSGTPVSGVDPDFSRYDKSVVVLDNIERQSHPLSASTPAGVEALGLDPVVRSDNLFREAVDLSRRWVDERHLPTVFFSDTPFGVNGSSYVGSYLRTNPTQTVCVTAGRLGKRYVRLFDLPDYAMDCGFSLGAVLAVMVGLMTSHAVSCETARDGSVNLNVKWLNPFCTSSVVVEVPSSNFAHFDCSFVLVALESVNCDVRVVGLLDVLTRPREYGLSGVAVARRSVCLSSIWTVPLVRGVSLLVDSPTRRATCFIRWKWVMGLSPLCCEASCCFRRADNVGIGLFRSCRTARAL